MATATTNKGFTLQGNGENSGQWGQVLNEQVFTYVDTNLGGVLEVAVPTIAPYTKTLNTAESKNAILRITGNLVANVTITVPANITINSTTVANSGFFFVENLTSGNYTVTIKNSVSATGALVPQGSRATLINDPTNGVRIASNDGFASGTSTLFFNTSAPYGWTKSVTHDNKALRIVSSSGGGTGGSTGFTSVFAARTITSSNLPDHTITITDPGHTHGITRSGGILTQNGASRTYDSFNGNNNGINNPSIQTNTTGITAAFGTTARGGAQTAMDFAVQYVDAIICVKD